MIENININKLTEFPLIDATFDAVTEYQILCKLSEKTNEIIKYLNDDVKIELKKYIDDILKDYTLDGIYDSTTETLMLVFKN